MFPLASRMELISESITLKVSAKANALKKAGVDVVGFGAGEPDFDTPAFIKDAAKVALDKGQTKYTPTPSILELKQAIAEKFNRENSLPYKPEQITLGAGGKHCLYMAFMAILNPGDIVKSDGGFVARKLAGAAFAETESLVGPAAGLPHHEDQHADKNQGGQEQR